MSNRTVCFQCGNAVTDQPKLNRLPNGENCPACVERAYAEVPAPLPREVTEESPFEPTNRQNEMFPDLDEPA